MPRKPFLNYFSETELDLILEEAFKILETTGVYLPNKKAKSVLKKAGAKEKAGDIVTLPRQLIEEILGQCTSRFKLYNQTGTDFLQLEIGNTFYGPGSDLRYVIDLETEKPRLSKLEDAAKHLSIIDSLPQYDFLMSTSLPSDIPPEDLYESVFRAMILNSDKPIIATATTLQDLEKVHQLAVEVAGSEKSFREKPFYAAYLEPISPLKMEEDIANRIMFYAEKSAPLLFAAGANIAVHAPATPEGAVIQGTAESFSGLALAYLINPATKFIFGANSAGFDGKKGIVSYGAPEWSKTMAYYTELARKINLPVWGAGGCTDSNVLDGQAGFEAAISLLMAELSGATLIHDAGYLSHGDLTDPRAYIMCAEIINRVKWLTKRGAINPGEIIKVVDEVFQGETSTFLETNHARRNYHLLHQPSKWVDRNNYHEKQKSLIGKLKEEAHNLLKGKQVLVEGEVPNKREISETANRSVEPIEIKKERSKTLEDFFQENIAEPEKIKKHLEERLVAGQEPEKLYSQLTQVLEKSLEGEDENIDLVLLLGYVNLFNEAAETILPRLKQIDEKTPFVLGTVEGDKHWIGKTLVSQLVGVFGYEVIDVGVDVETSRLIYHLLDSEANLVGLSTLLTTTRDNMEKTIKVLQDLGIKDQVGVIIGGAVVNKPYAKKIDADAYRKDAVEAGKALDGIKDKFIDVCKRKKTAPENFIIIGESINSISKKVKAALENKDQEMIVKLAKKQLEQGADYLDVAVSHLADVEKQKEAIQWATTTIQKNCDTPLCFDSDNHRVIKAALESYNPKNGPALINSTTLEKERMERMVEMAVKHNSYIVFLAEDGKTPDEKIKIVEQFVKYASAEGIPTEKIFIDPGLETMAVNPESAKIALQTISSLKDLHPELHYTVGLTNIGYGLGKMSRTKSLQRSFLDIGGRLGLDSAITNPSILKTEFQEPEKALSESIGFLAGLISGLQYREKIKNDSAYDPIKC